MQMHSLMQIYLDNMHCIFAEHADAFNILKTETYRLSE